MKNQFHIIVLLVILTMLLVLGSASAAAAPKSPEYWPTEGWRTSAPEDQGMDSDTLASLVQKIGQQGYGIDNVTVIRNGYIVTDAYFYPFKKGLKHIIHSCTKSITSALIGIAIDEGHIESVDVPVLDLFPDRTPSNLDDNKRAMTLEHLLMMSSGLRCRDSYLYDWEGMREMRASRDWIQFVLDLPMREAPGTRFEYCNGVSYLLSAILQKTTRKNALVFARQHLFDPLGISDVDWPVSPQFVNIGWGEMWLTPHDMAKFGFLYLNEGRWENEQVVPGKWVDASTRQQIQARTMAEGYGYQWWIPLGEYYEALGYGGQYIIVLPEQNMIVVFTGALAGRDFFKPVQLLYDYIIMQDGSSGPLPANPRGRARLDSVTSAYADPVPKPIRPLPEVAKHVSGKTFEFDANELRFRSVALTFQEGEREGLLKLSNPYSTIEAAVGLDDVFRFTQYGGSLRAYKGFWEDDTTFTIHYQIVGNTQRGTARLVFTGSKLMASMKDFVSDRQYDLVGWLRD